MIKGFKIRLYPTKEQEAKMWQHIGACRFVWNYMLALQTERYENGEKYLSRFDMIKLLTPLKQQEEYGWLCGVSAASLQAVCSDLNEAYQRCFNHTANKPKFKSRKRSKAAYPIGRGCDRLWFSESLASVEKIGKVKYRSDKSFPLGKGQKFTNPRVSYANGKWILSFGMECENQATVLSDEKMGIDLGIKELAVVAFGNEQFVFHNINKSKRVRSIKRRIKLLQRAISRKYEANKQGRKFVKTNNIERDEAKLRRLQARLANIRNNYIHQTTHKLVSLLPSRVTMEDLNVTGMMRNKHLSKAIQEQCLSEFIRQMKYKCEFSGIPFVQVSRFYPSSKMCSCCGRIKKDLKLSDRVYVCECGNNIDRDYNAAINLMRYEA